MINARHIPHYLFMVKELQDVIIMAQSLRDMPWVARNEVVLDPDILDSFTIGHKKIYAILRRELLKKYKNSPISPKGLRTNSNSFTLDVSVPDYLVALRLYNRTSDPIFTRLATSWSRYMTIFPANTFSVSHMPFGARYGSTSFKVTASGKPYFSAVVASWVSISAFSSPANRIYYRYRPPTRTLTNLLDLFMTTVNDFYTENEEVFLNLQASVETYKNICLALKPPHTFVKPCNCTVFEYIERVNNGNNT